MLALFRPHRPRRRRALVAALVALSAALTVASAPSAPADELGNRQRRVHHQITRAQADLDDSTKALVRATARVRDAERSLRAAQRVLAGRQADLAAAKILDAQMQSELAAANARLDSAKTALAQGRHSQQVQQRVLREAAAETYESGSPALMGLTMVLTSNDPGELSTQLNVVQNVMDRETATLQRLEASKVLLKLQERQVSEAQQEVARRRAAAAESLARTKTLEARAEVASADVAKRLHERTKARRAASKEKRADQRRLHQLNRERNRISALIRRHEAQLRRSRSRAATARAINRSRSRTAPLMKPIDTYITSPYGMRLHPIYHRWTLHDGTDFGAACGTPIHAAADGRVIARYYNVGYGNRLIVADGYMRGVSISTAYNHLSRYSAYVGQYVHRGDIVGYVGTTGFSTGCHLHFMVFVNGHTVDPEKWLP